MGGDDIPYSGFKRFNTPSDLSKYLVESGFNLINGSNNHALDKKVHMALIIELIYGKSIKKRELCSLVYTSLKR